MGEMYYNLPAIIAASEEIARVQAMTNQNLDHSHQILNAALTHFHSMTAEQFQHAITIVNNAYSQASQDLHMAANAVQFASEHVGNMDQMSAAQYG
jgi:hypothetical protein